VLETDVEEASVAYAATLDPAGDGGRMVRVPDGMAEDVVGTLLFPILDLADHQPSLLLCKGSLLHLAQSLHEDALVH